MRSSRHLSVSQTFIHFASAAALLSVAACGMATPSETSFEVRVIGDAASGTVVSEPAGIACGNSCVASFEAGTMVSLRALPAAGFELVGWQGPCAGAEPVCSFPVTESVTVTAQYRRTPPQGTLIVTRVGSGTGTVTSNIGGLSCGQVCTIKVALGTMVTLSALAEAGSSFGGFSGGSCAGSGLSCQVVVDSDVAVAATFGKPMSCDQIKSAAPDAQDGAYKLYVNGDVSKPWDGYCMFGSPSATYLTLAKTGTANFSQYTAGGGRVGTNVRTSFTRVRIDPENLLIDETDLRFATSTGSVTDGSVTIRQVNYGTAADCVSDYSTRGIGNVDLTGTPFTVGPNAFVTSGYQAAGSSNYSADSKIVTLTGGGFCGGTSVRQGPKKPFNLPLVYVGQ